MTDEEKKALFTALGSILAHLVQIEVKADAAADALAQTVPAFHSEYQKALVSRRNNVADDTSTMLEYLRKTLGKNNQ